MLCRIDCSLQNGDGGTFCMPEELKTGFKETFTEHWTQKGNPVLEYKEASCKRILIDGGGMAFQHEKIVNFTLADIEFEGYLRHLPSFLNMVQRRKELEDLPGYFRFTSWPFFTYILPIEMKNQLISILQELILQGEPEIHATELARLQVTTEAGLIQKSRCVFCGSEKNYAECCGKTVPPEQIN